MAIDFLLPKFTAVATIPDEKANMGLSENVGLIFPMK